MCYFEIKYVCFNQETVPIQQALCGKVQFSCIYNTLAIILKSQHGYM